MKKKLLFLLVPFLILGMTGCVKYNGRGKSSSSAKASSAEPATSESGVSPTTSADSSNGGNSQSSAPVGGEVKIYLAFGQYGKYQGNFVTSSIDALFLEHAIEFSAKVGDNLPGKEDVTSSVSGSEFKAWIAYNNDGKLTEYTKVPGESGKVLYASFSGGNGSSQGSGETPSPDKYTASSTGELPTEGFGFKFSDGSYMAAFRTDDSDGFQQYLISNRAFKKDQSFQLYDFGSKAGWTVNVDPYSFGGDSASSTAWKAYIDHSNNQYKVLKDFNVESVYIKLKFESDQLYFQLGN